MNDLKLTPVNEGLEISIVNGAAELAGGIDNSIYLSLFTPPYWGNSIEDPGDRYTSTIPDIMGAGLLTAQTRLDVIAAAERALAWMVSEGVAERIEVDAEIPSFGTLYVAVKIYEPTQEAGVVYRYGINWESQRITVMGAA